MFCDATRIEIVCLQDVDRHQLETSVNLRRVLVLFLGVVPLDGLVAAIFGAQERPDLLVDKLEVHALARILVQIGVIDFGFLACQFACAL